MKPFEINAINSSPQIRTGKVEPGRPKAADLSKPSALGHDSDQIKVTNLHDQVGRLVERANSHDQIRQQRVDSVRLLIQAGNYRVHASDIADAILRDEV